MNIKKITLTLTLMGVIASNSEAISNYASQWSEPVVIDSGPSNAYRTDIAFDRNGNAIAVFEQKSGNVYRIFASSYINGKGWQGAVAIDSGIGNAYRGQVAFDREGNAIAVFKQADRIFANRYIYNEGWQEPVTIDNNAGMADGQDIVFDNEGNAAAVFEEHNGKEFGIYINFYSSTDTNTDTSKSGWSGAFRIDSGPGNAYFPYPIFDDKGNLYVIYYKEEAGGLEVYVSKVNNSVSDSVGVSKKTLTPNTGTHTNTDTYITHVRITDRNTVIKEEKWVDKKSEITRGIKAVYNPIFLSELKKRIYSGNYSYSRWETPSKLDARFRDTYRPTLLVNGNGNVTALFVKWDGEYLSAYTANYINGKWGKPEEIDAGKGDVEHIRGAVNSKGEMAVVWTQWVNGNLRIHARVKNSVSDSDSVNKKNNTDTNTHTDTSSWGEAKIIDAGEKDGYNPSVAFTEKGEIIAVWCQWEKVNVKSYSNVYRKRNNPLTPFIKGERWGKAERIENKEGETCGVRIVSGPDEKSIAIFEQEGFKEAESESGGKPTNRIFAVEYQSVKVSESQSVKVKNTDTEYTVKRLTGGSNEDYYAEFSPDGNKIVFVSTPPSPPLTKRGDKKGGSNLYIMDWDGKNRRQLTFGNVVDAAPAFTPDGKRIIFTSNRTDESLPLNDSIRGPVPEGINRGWDIWSINTDGTELTRITKAQTNELAPRPTPDGKNIVFISTAGGDHAIWSMDINGDNPKRLTSGGTGDWFPAMNPDGKELVFVSTRLGNGDIWTIDLVEKKYNRLTYTDLPEFSPAWSPDGSKIAFVTNKGGSFEIWVMDRDGANKKRLTKGISDGNWGSRFSSKKILETAGYYHLSWHPDGTKILFTEWGDEEKVSVNSVSVSERKDFSDSDTHTQTHTNRKTYISILEFDKEIIDKLEADGASIPDYTLIGERELTKGEWEDFGPSFSSDGTSLIFSSNRSGNWDIWGMEFTDNPLTPFNKGELRQLTDEKADDIAPVFSPDGKEIAFLKGSKLKAQSSKELLSAFSFELSTYDIWVMKSDGSEARQVTKGIPVLSYPAWHPDGKEIAFVAKGSDGHEIWTYNLKSKIQNSKFKIQNSHDDSRFYPFKEFLYRIGYNPTGDKITFESNVSGNVEIWTMKSDGTNLARITNGDSPHWNPVWSPDGKMIAYTTDKLGEDAGHHNWRNYNIWVANPETQKEKLITGEEQIDWNPVWSPDGKKIVYVTNRSGDLKHFSLWVLYLK